MTLAQTLLSALTLRLSRVRADLIVKLATDPRHRAHAAKAGAASRRARLGIYAALPLAVILSTEPAKAARLSHSLARFDGRWSVEVVTERGNCSRAYRYGIFVRNGQVSYAGREDFTISGRVQSSGLVRGSITRGANRVAVAGRLWEGYGQGSWASSGEWNCGGYWNAEQRSL